METVKHLMEIVTVVLTVTVTVIAVQMFTAPQVQRSCVLIGISYYTIYMLGEAQTSNFQKKLISIACMQNNTNVMYDIIIRHFFGLQSQGLVWM